MRQCRLGFGVLEFWDLVFDDVPDDGDVDLPVLRRGDVTEVLKVLPGHF